MCVILILGRQPSLSIDEPRFSRQRLPSPFYDVLFPPAPCPPLPRWQRLIASGCELPIGNRLLRYCVSAAPSGVGFLRFVRSFPGFRAPRKKERKEGRKEAKRYRGRGWNTRPAWRMRVFLAARRSKLSTTFRIINFRRLPVRSKVNSIGSKVLAFSSMADRRCLTSDLVLWEARERERERERERKKKKFLPPSR